MKKFKKLLTLLVAFAMTLCVFAMAACDTPSTGDEAHVCGHVCTECGKCTDKDCDDEVCADKCLGHNTEEEHECKDKCPTCGKCTTECEEPECAEKCPGHGGEEEHKCEHVCTECGKCLDGECADPACQEKCLGHEHECKDKCPTCDKCTTECEEEECAEKCEGHEDVEVYTITLVVGEGTLPEGAKTEYKTNAEGLLDIEGYLPTATANTAHWHFLGWYTEATGGDEVIEDETVFLADGNIYAQYGRDNGLWSGANSDVWKGDLIQNTYASGSGLIYEYWLGDGKTVNVEVGEKLAVAMNGKIMPHYIISTVGVEAPSTSGKVSYVTVTVAGELKLYLKLYTHATDKENWCVEWAGATKVETGSDVPEGCDAVKITFGGGSVVTLYLVDGNGNSVGAADFSKYCIYTFSGEIFGNWDASATNGVLKANMTVSSSAIPGGWIIRWRSSASGSFTAQTKNIENVIKAGGIYLIKLPKNSQGEHTITEITPAA